MIALLKGSIIYKFDDHVIVDVQGVGYEVYMPALKIAESLGHNGKIYVIEYTNIPHGIQKNVLTEIFSKLGLIPHEIYSKKNTLLIEYNFTS